MIIDALTPSRACVVNKDMDGLLALRKLAHKSVHLTELLEIRWKSNTRARGKRVQLGGSCVTVLRGARGDVNFGPIFCETCGNLRIGGGGMSVSWRMQLEAGRLRRTDLPMPLLPPVTRTTLPLTENRAEAANDSDMAK
jgi:hypothetical protein